MRNALLRRPLDRPHDDERGLLLDHLVACEIHRRTGTPWPEARLFHFRTRAGAEVDFVLEVGREAWGIEVKASRDVAHRALSGLAALQDHLPRLRRRLVVFLGPRPLRLADGIEAVPLPRFLAELPRQAALRGP